jgi:hypothetical protein
VDRFTAETEFTMAELTYATSFPGRTFESQPDLGDSDGSLRGCRRREHFSAETQPRYVIAVGSQNDRADNKTSVGTVDA